MNTEEKTKVLEWIAQGEKLLVGIGPEWKADRNDSQQRAERIAQYNALAKLLAGKDYFLVTTNTDAVIFESDLWEARIAAPCGNETWRQCSKACTKDIWEPGEVPEDICPHCGAPLTGNTVKAETYIEEGYLPKWKAYMAWLATTVNKKLVVLELGVDFSYPTVARWPFEKNIYFNRKSHMYRVNEGLAQLTPEIAERAESVNGNSVSWILELGE